MGKRRRSGLVHPETVLHATYGCTAAPAAMDKALHRDQERERRSERWLQKARRGRRQEHGTRANPVIEHAPCLFVSAL